MTEKKIRKVITKKVAAEEVLKGNEVSKVSEELKEAVNTEQAGQTKKACFFCQSGKTPNYTDMAVLKRYTTDRAKIVARAKSNVCSRHQRAVAKQVKHARHLALLPFIPQV